MVDIAHKNSGHFGPRGGTGGFKCTGCPAGDQAPGVGPLHSGERIGRNAICVCVGCKISGHGGVILLVSGVAVQNRCHLLTGYGVIRAEGAVIIAADNAVFAGPENRVGVPLAGSHRQSNLAADGGCPPFDKVPDQHGAGHVGTGLEGGGGSAGEQPVLYGKFHPIIEPVAGLHIGERILPVFIAHYIMGQMLCAEGSKSYPYHRCNHDRAFLRCLNAKP